MTWRIGSVPYLNVRPLIYGLEEQVIPCEPARLADLLYRGQLDVGMVPIAEVLRHDRYDILDGIAIASHGPVQSVLLFHQPPLERLRRVAVDTASRTSVLLLRMLLKGCYGVEPKFYPRPPGAAVADHEAMLLIGDTALWQARQTTAVPAWDLGQAWQDWTGLAFVYAVWAGPRGVFDGGGLGALLRRAKANGLAHLDDIVQDASELPAEFLRQYYTQAVQYELGAAEKAGVRRFQQLAVEMGLLPANHDLRYVP